MAYLAQLRLAFVDFWRVEGKGRFDRLHLLSLVIQGAGRYGGCCLASVQRIRDPRRFYRVLVRVCVIICFVPVLWRILLIWILSGAVTLFRLPQTRLRVFMRGCAMLLVRVSEEFHPFDEGVLMA